MLTHGAAWFTDSSRAQLYRLDRGAGGRPGTSVATLPLTGEWRQVAGFNANGISTTEAHVRVAIGLDYLGAAPIRGSRTGGGTETLDVKLRVEQGRDATQS